MHAITHLRAVGRPARMAATAMVLVLASACGASIGGGAATAVGSATSSPAGTAGQATCSYPADLPAAKPVAVPPVGEPATGTVTVTLTFADGPVVIGLARAAAPCTVGSFVHLAQVGYFNSTPCHRLTASASLSVLQCGDPSGTGGGGPGYSFADELNAAMTYPQGTVAMANAGPDTNGSQFFLVYADSQLPPAYTVFGHVTSGLPVLTTIAARGVAGGGQDGAPATPVVIKTAVVS